MNTPSRKLAGKVAVVTGAAKGIGAAIAKHLAAEGAAVVVNYASKKGGADKVVAEITSAGGKAVAAQGDVAKKGEIERLFAETKKAFGALDILVNSAGVYELAPVGQITEELFHRHFKLNVFVGIVQAFLKVPALKALAPKQAEPPFLIAQLVVLMLFLALGIVAAIKFRNEPVRSKQSSQLRTNPSFLASHD
jgi:NAD(P)-dependent dehydrogenase (short-subunit alcohol dehydrogenase family)